LFYAIAICTVVIGSKAEKSEYNQWATNVSARFEILGCSAMRPRGILVDRIGALIIAGE